MKKDENQTKIYEASEFLPATLDKLLAEDEDKKRIIIDQFAINLVDNNAKIWIEGNEYFTTSKYVIDTLKILDEKKIPCPFAISLIRKQSGDGNIYYDLRP